MKFKINLQDGGHGGHLGLPIRTILATFYLQVTLIFPNKFQVNWPLGSRDVQCILWRIRENYPPVIVKYSSLTTPQHKKMYLRTCMPSEDSAWASMQSDPSLFQGLLDSQGPKADRKDTDQIATIPMLILVFARYPCLKVHFLMP